MKLSGNTILITGGSGGIGLEMAKQFLEQNNKVIITGRNEEKLNKAKEEYVNLHTIQSDVSKIEDVKALYEKVSTEFPELNVLINNAGIMFSVNVQNHDFSPEKLTREVDVNVKGPIWMVDTFLPLLKKNPDSAIVNVTSGLAFVPLPLSPVYCATKAALHSYSISLRVQLSNTPIKVFELAPPATQTDILDDFEANDMKGIPIMALDKMVKVFLKGFAKDTLEIRPGMANSMKFMSRYFPNFIQKQLNKPVARLHS